MSPVNSELGCSRTLRGTHLLFPCAATIAGYGASGPYLWMPCLVTVAGGPLAVNHRTLVGAGVEEPGRPSFR